MNRRILIVAGAFLLCADWVGSAPVAQAASCATQRRELRSKSRRVSKLRRRLRKLLLSSGPGAEARSAEVAKLQPTLAGLDIEVDRLKVAVKSCPVPRRKPRRRKASASKSAARKAAARKRAAKRRAAKAAAAKAAADKAAADKAAADKAAADKAAADKAAADKAAADKAAADKAAADKAAADKAAADKAAADKAATKPGSTVARVRLAPQRLLPPGPLVQSCVDAALQSDHPPFEREGVRRSAPGAFSAWHERRRRYDRARRIHRRMRELIERCPRRSQ